MTETFYKIQNHNIDHRTFGGIIYASDFNTDCKKNNSTSGSAIAKRIASDLAFDKECSKKQIARIGGNRYDQNKI